MLITSQEKIKYMTSIIRNRERALISIVAIESRENEITKYKITKFSWMSTFTTMKKKNILPNLEEQETVKLKKAVMSCKKMT